MRIAILGLLIIATVAGCVPPQEGKENPNVPSVRLTKDSVRIGMSKQDVTQVLGPPFKKVQKVDVVDVGIIEGDIWVFHRSTHNPMQTWWIVFEEGIVSRLEYFENWGDK